MHKDGQAKPADKQETFDPHRSQEKQAERETKTFARPGTEKRG